jgi:hypothetical protein
MNQVNSIQSFTSILCNHLKSYQMGRAGKQVIQEGYDEDGVPLAQW